MKVLHICSSLSKDIGGPARSIQGLVAALNQVGVDAPLLALKPLGGPWVDGIAEFECAGRMSCFGVEAAVSSMIEKCNPDIVHIQSVWMLNMHMAALACRKKGVPYIYSTRGALNRWAFAQKELKKRIALWLYQGRDFKCARAIHATSDEEALSVRKKCSGTEVFVCPNGVNVPAQLPEWEQRCDGKRKLLFLSRIHPSKGLSELINAWANVPGELREGWVLEIVGNDDTGCWRDLWDLICSLGLEGSVRYKGYAGDCDKWQVYRSADCFILPSYSENFGIVVAEALYAGLPAIVSRRAPWADLERTNCGWWVDLDVSALAKAIVGMMRLSDLQRAEMGTRGHNLVCCEYMWKAVAQRMKEHYAKLLGGMSK